MTSNHVKTTLMGKHKINKVSVEIYFTPVVIEAYASADDISVINNLKPGEEYDLYPLEMHFKNIFQTVKSRVLELKTYEMFFDNIEYEGHHLVWRSNFDEKSKLMKIGVTYSHTNSPKYKEELNRDLEEWRDAEARGEDMDELIKQQFEASKERPNKPILVGFVPSPKDTTH